MLSAPLRIGVLCSKRAPGLDALLAHRANGLSFDVACCVTSEEDSVVSHPSIIHSIGQFRGRRREYDAITADILDEQRVDAVVMLGYLYVATSALLSCFPGRIINVHDSDLPKYPGLHATRDAIVAGERETRSVVHLVTEQLDAGPVLARSDGFPVAPFALEAAKAGQIDIVRAYAYAHREWMMRRCWADLVVSALETMSLAEAV